MLIIVLPLYWFLALTENQFLFDTKTTGRSYFFSNSGNDSNDGSEVNPWKTIDKLNKTQLHPGDTVYFESGQTFPGNILLDANDAGSEMKSIMITSTGNGKAVINGANGTAFTAY